MLQVYCIDHEVAYCVKHETKGIHVKQKKVISVHYSYLLITYMSRLEGIVFN